MKRVGVDHRGTKTGYRERADGRSADEQARLRSMSLYLIRFIVENHGGAIEIDPATNTILIDVPREKEVACAKDIENQVGKLCL